MITIKELLNINEKANGILLAHGILPNDINYKDDKFTIALQYILKNTPLIHLNKNNIKLNCPSSYSIISELNKNYVKSAPPTDIIVTREVFLTIFKAYPDIYLSNFTPLTAEEGYTKHGISRGLGDTIDKFTTMTGIKEIVNTIKPKGCGCKKRQEKLNEVIPYEQK